MGSENLDKKGRGFSRRHVLRHIGAIAAVKAVEELGAGTVIDPVMGDLAKEEASTTATGSTTVADVAFDLMSKEFKLETEGAEHLREIPKDKRIVFLTTHFSDIDVAAAIAGIAKEGKRNLKVAELSTHANPMQAFGPFLTRMMGGGSKNFFSVSHEKGKGGEATAFNPADFEPMKRSIADGYHLVMAAYFDIRKTYEEKRWELPEKGGYGGVYLSQITPDCVILPVAVNIDTPEPIAMGGITPGELFKHHGARVRVHFGKALEPQRIDGIERFSQLLKKGKDHGPLSEQEYQEFSDMRRKLRSESDRVMASLSAMVPQQKRAASKGESVS